MPDTVPAYARMERMLAQRIRRSLKPGDLLPTQKELADEAGVSLITVKRALAELARQGLIEGVRGRGTVVRRPTIADNHAGVSSWTDSITGLGATPATAWTRVAARTPPPRIARLLALDARSRTVLIQRLRTADGAPVCLMSNEIPAALVPGLERTGVMRESLYDDLRERFQIVPHSAQEEVTARAARPREREMLQCADRIVLVVTRLTLDALGRPIEHARIVAPASRYRYRVDLHHQIEPQPSRKSRKRA